MTQVTPTTPPGFDTLTVEEKIRYVQDLWDSIAENPDDIPLSDEHREILVERLEAHRKNPTAGRPWSEVRDELLKRLEKR